jgi:FkbM family methyltransferase
MKGAVRGALNHVGYDLRRVGSAEPDPMPFYVQRALHLYAIDLVVDIGANRGQFGTELRLGGYRDALVSFEPIPECRDALADVAARHGGWQVRGEALGENDAAAVPMNVAAWDQVSSFLETKPEVMAAFGDSYGVSRVESVPMARLDTIWDSIVPTGAKIMLKTDAQGYDMRILRGAGEKLSLVSCILMEVGMRPAYIGSDNGLGGVLSFLDEFGFRLAALSSAAHGRAVSPSLALGDADAFFVRPTLQQVFE